jgi:hypothetical protein
MALRPQVEGKSEAVDVAGVLRRNYLVLGRLLLVRLVLAATLISVPFVAQGLGAPDSGWWFVPAVAGIGVAILTVYRVRCGVRLVQCAKVLRHYPLEYRPQVRQKASQWAEYGTVHTVKLPVPGQHGAPWMWAINAAGPRKWPAGTEHGMWFAGDPPFGGVLVVPESNTLMFLNPEDWEKTAHRREEAGPERQALARSANIHKRNWRKPVVFLGG